MTNRHIITLENAKSYATEANLDKALERLGLASYTSTDGMGREITCRYIKALTPEGRWTAIFLVGEHANHCGGYVGFAAQHGFMSV